MELFVANLNAAVNRELRFEPWNPEEAEHTQCAGRAGGRLRP
jgi:hypothetical protein